ncbi:uncharacterized protein LOC104851711 [Fukomys damarensis]|uniref:uncharacterized protein LOC104851711 n=1 Tax=Fukomys damarensis TaxID=885580 RepID=UPI0014552AF7|nr:uncharacterized protein LOC104851711 [Fukomys damarensis]
MNLADVKKPETTEDMVRGLSMSFWNNWAKVIKDENSWNSICPRDGHWGSPERQRTQRTLWEFASMKYQHYFAKFVGDSPTHQLDSKNQWNIKGGKIRVRGGFFLAFFKKRACASGIQGALLAVVTEQLRQGRRRPQKDSIWVQIVKQNSPLVGGFSFRLHPTEILLLKQGSSLSSSLGRWYILKQSEKKNPGEFRGTDAACSVQTLLSLSPWLCNSFSEKSQSLNKKRKADIFDDTFPVPKSPWEKMTKEKLVSEVRSRCLTSRNNGECLSASARMPDALEKERFQKNITYHSEGRIKEEWHFGKLASDTCNLTFSRS